MTIYEKIDLILKSKKMSRRKLAQKAGILEGTLSTAFSRKTKLKFDTLSKIANALDMSIHTLLRGTDEEAQLPRRITVEVNTDAKSEEITALKTSITSHVSDINDYEALKSIELIVLTIWASDSSRKQKMNQVQPDVPLSKEDTP